MVGRLQALENQKKNINKNEEIFKVVEIQEEIWELETSQRREIGKMYKKNEDNIKVAELQEV